MAEINKEKTGFTLVELMISIAILMILFALTSVNLTRIPAASDQAAAKTTLLSDIKFQQTLSMSGSMDGGSTSDTFGIYFETSRYTLFRGNAYNPNDTSNFVVEMEPTVTLTDITWPSESVIFEKGSGNVLGYLNGNDSITISNSVTGDNEVIRINKYGATY